MSKNTAIENEQLRVTIRLDGGNLTSVYDKELGKELLFQGDKRGWTGQDLVIFPFIARLKDGYYLDGGQRYDMRIHGFAPYSDFELVENSGDKMTILLRSSAETKAVYPYDFELFVTYQLCGKGFSVSYRVVNHSDRTMPFGIGGHPGFILPAEDGESLTDTSGNYLYFDTDQELTSVVMDESNFFVKGTEKIGASERIELAKSAFQNDAMLFEKVKGSVTIAKRDGQNITVDIGGAPVLAVWAHKQYGGYVCIEPWWGAPDSNPVIREMADKKYINKLASGESFACEYSVKIS